jgi:hypothetical protein
MKELMDLVRRINLAGASSRCVATGPLKLPSKAIDDFTRDIPIVIDYLRKKYSQDKISESIQLNKLPNWLESFIDQSLFNSTRFFRPDCVVTADGIKIVEFNIDFGSCGVEVGIELKRLMSAAGVALQDLNQWFNADQAYVDYLIGRCHGRPLLIWDIEGRSKEFVSDRMRFLSLLEQKGLDTVLCEGAIKSDLARGKVVLRYFAYPHFLGLANLHDSLRVLDQKVNDVDVSSCLLDSKQNMAMLYESAVAGSLPEPINSIVLKYVLPTFKVNDKVRSQLLQEKDRWVIKRFSGFQGNAVWVGRDVDEALWGQVVTESLLSDDCVCQYFCEATSMQVAVTDGNSLWQHVGPHLINFFFIDNTYSGAIGRLGLLSNQKKIGRVDGLSSIPVFVVGVD